MADLFSIAKRKQIMSSIKGRNTSPEKIVRQCLRRLGHSFRSYSADLPGNPDIVLSKVKKVIFVHGCFWHNHKDCKRSALPQTNRSFWKKKIKGNADRDKAIQIKLRKIGWWTLTVWQCQTKNLGKLEKRIDTFIKE
jgi:DNA mismatch endonuclease (patch repair protein)